MAKAATAEPAPAEPKKQRTFASNVTVSLAVMNMQTDLLPVKQGDGAVKFKIVCPDCDDTVTMDQKYICTEDESHVHTSGTAARAKDVDGVLVKVTAEDIEAIKEPTLEPNQLDLQVYPADQVDAATRPVGVAYRVRPKPTKGSMQVYGVLRDLFADESVAYIGEMTIRSEQKLFRAEVWHGQILLQELARPELVAPVDQIDVTYDTKLLKTAKALADALVEDFDPEAFRSVVQQRAAEFDAAQRAAATGTAPAPKKKAAPKQDDSTDALLAALEASVTQIKAKKPASKPAARKPAAKAS